MKNRVCVFSILARDQHDEEYDYIHDVTHSELPGYYLTLVKPDNYIDVFSSMSVTR